LLFGQWRGSFITFYFWNRRNSSGDIYRGTLLYRQAQFLRNF